MKKMMSGLCATALAVSMAATGLFPANAAPTYVPHASVQGPGEVVKVQYGAEEWRWRRLNRDRREYWREVRRDRREARRDFYGDRSGYYRGYRGYRDYRPGYRRYGDYWYPAAAFLAGALVTGAIVNSQPRVVYREGGSHTQWCYDRYRSYRAYDNTFQPYYGQRQQCISPY